MRRLAILLLVLAFSPLAARAQGTITQGRYVIEIVATGKVLDLRTEDKRSVQQWANGGGRNQQWDLEDAGGGFFYIRSAENGKALDSADARARDGSALIVADKRDSDNQKWKIAENGNGQYTIVSRAGKSLESPAGKREDGARLQVWGPHGLENQRFRLTRLGDVEARVRPRDGSATPGAAPPPAGFTGFRGQGRYNIQSVASGHYLDLRREDNQTLQQWSGSGAKNQMWEAEDAGKGYFFLRNVENGRYLDAAGTRDGSPIYTRDRTGRDSQRWRIVDAGQAESLIVARNGKVIDLTNSERREGQALQIWGEHRRENQRFRFNQIDASERFVGGRTRESRGVGPSRDAIPSQEPYSSGKVTWRGRVDTEVVLEIRGASVTEKSAAGRAFNNGKYTFTSPMPARELDVRVQNRKVRGSVVVVEKPSPANNFTAVIRITDPQRDAADYEFELIW
ncbi:MAG: RICIN domain-containing protein [Blastocatellia bacterium]|nr:RICIN domain-containing protein [Blastocatellia bacterium]